MSDPAIEVFVATSLDCTGTPVPSGWRFRCWQCKHQSGTYGFIAQCTEDGAAHTEHRCPGPWLLDENAEIPTVWNSKLVTSADTLAKNAIREDARTQGEVPNLDRPRLRS